jgi:hypothetical protein
MKTKVTLFLSMCVIASVFSIPAYSQGKIVETKYFKNNPDLGGDVVINSSTKEVTGDKSFTTFEIEAKASGSYALSLWASPVLYPNGKYSVFDVYVNGTKTPGQIKFTKGNWQTIALPKKVTVKQGINTIAFSPATGKEEIPAIEFIRLSSDTERAKISSAAYDDYLAEAKAGSFNRTGQIQPSNKDSLLNYLYFDTVPFSYTYYRLYPFNANQQVSVSASTPNDSIFLIIDVFSASSPDTSWATPMQPNPSINITIPFSDAYYIVVRPYWNGVLTTATVTVNGIKEEDVQVSSTGLRAMQDTLAVYNTFTVRSEGDPQIWITEYASPEKITSYNNDYGSHGGDFSWGLNARIKKRFSRPVDAIIVSSYGTCLPTGHTEVYAKCQDSDTIGFPHLKADDAIQSDPVSTVYNSISWSGGITGYWEWPPFPSSAYYVHNNPLASFDLFYNSYRYPGCEIFTRYGATSDNSAVDLWAVAANDTNYVYTHASIKKGADGNPHGYDWESKLGDLQRTFHPRMALRGSSYGDTARHYKQAWSWQTRTLAEAIADGKAVLENVRLNDAETALIKRNIVALPPDEVKTFRALFAAWQSTLGATSFSNPYLFKNSQYKSLLAFCRSRHDLISLVYDKLNEEQFTILLIEDLTFTDNARNQSILASIRNSSDKQIRTTRDGATIVSSPYSNMVKYVKALLAIDSK